MRNRYSRKPNGLTSADSRGPEVKCLQVKIDWSISKIGRCSEVTPCSLQCARVAVRHTPPFPPRLQVEAMLKERILSTLPPNHTTPYLSVCSFCSCCTQTQPKHSVRRDNDDNNSGSSSNKNNNNSVCAVELFQKCQSGILEQVCSHARQSTLVCKRRLCVLMGVYRGGGQWKQEPHKCLW